MQVPDFLAPFDELVLTAVIEAGNGADDLQISSKVRELARRKTISWSRIEIALRLLESEGCLYSWPGAPGPDSIANPPRHYRIQLRGESALKVAIQRRDSASQRDYFKQASRFGIIGDIMLGLRSRWDAQRRDKRRNSKIGQAVARCWPDPPAHEEEAAYARVWEKLEQELKKRDTSLRSLYGDGWSAPALKQREFQVLTAAAMLKNQGTLPAISNVAGNWVKGLKTAHVQKTLSQLEARGLLAPVQNGYHLTEDGESALARAHAEGKALTNAK